MTAIEGPTGAATHHDDQQLLTPAEIAKALRASARTVRRWIAGL